MTWGSTAGAVQTQQQATGTGGGATYPTAQTTFQNYVNQGMVQNAPTFSQYQLANNAGLRNLAYGQAGYGLDTSNAGLNYTSGSRDLQTQMALNGIDLRAAQRQPGLIDQLLGLDNQDFGLQRKDYGIQRADAGLTAKQNVQNLFEQATGMGAMMSQGRRQRQGNIYENLVNQLGHIGVAEDRTGIAQDKNTLNATEQKQQAQDRIATLQTTADRLGMKPDELKAQLDNTLAKLGLNNTISTESLLDGLANNDLQSKQLLMNILSQAGQYATATG